MYNLPFLYVFIIGLFVGSFLNVLIDRIPKKQSIIFGRSYCDFCQKKLAWFDLIPVFSFVFLRGKCRFCKAELSSYYPIVELLTGVLFAAVVAFIPRTNLQFAIFNFQSISNVSSIKILDLIYYLFILSSLIVIFFTDLKYGVIPDKVLLPAIMVSIVYLPFAYRLSLIAYVLSGLGAFLFFLILLLVTRGQGMGFGDVKLAFLMGLFLGFPKIAFSLYIAFLTGSTVGIILILCKKKKFFGGKIPFGPFLVLGTILSVFLEGEIVKVLRSLNFW